MFLIEDECAISQYFQKIIDRDILGYDFPWFWQNSSTSEKFPFLSHTLIPRHNEHEDIQGYVNSQYYGMFNDIFKSFCMIHGLKVKRVLRASLNLALPFHRFPYTDPHVDHAIPHYGMLMYLNDWTGGSTVLFKEQTDGAVIDHPLDDVNSSLTIDTEIIPKKGKIAVFDGTHFHAHRFCQEAERRVVCVFTFTTYEH